MPKERICPKCNLPLIYERIPKTDDPKHVEWCCENIECGYRGPAKWEPETETIDEEKIEAGIGAWMEHFDMPFAEIRLLHAVNRAFEECQAELPAVGGYVAILNPQWDLKNCIQVAMDGVEVAIKSLLNLLHECYKSESHARFVLLKYMTNLNEFMRKTLLDVIEREGKQHEPQK